MSLSGRIFNSILKIDAHFLGSPLGQAPADQGQ